MIQAIVLMVVLGLILGLGLGLADKFLAVEVDERVETVASMLPGYNCGSCGYAGCNGMAEALVSGEVSKVGTCRPCKPDRKQEIVD
jgi:electron transport complex protein RnfB